MNNKFVPEGMLINRAENAEYLTGVAALEKAKIEKKILEARATLCSGDHELSVELGVCRGVIPRCEAAWCEVMIS